MLSKLIMTGIRLDRIALCKEKKINIRSMPAIAIFNDNYTTPHIRHQCMKTPVLRCHRCLICTGVKKMNKI